MRFFVFVSVWWIVMDDVRGVVMKSSVASELRAPLSPSLASFYCSSINICWCLYVRLRDRLPQESYVPKNKRRDDEKSVGRRRRRRLAASSLEKSMRRTSEMALPLFCFCSLIIFALFLWLSPSLRSGPSLPADRCPGLAIIELFSGVRRVLPHAKSRAYFDHVG